MGKMKERTRKLYRGKRKMVSKVSRKNTQVSVNVEDQTLVNNVNNPDAASNNDISQEHISASAKKFRVFGVTVDSDSENIVPSDTPDKFSDAYFIAQQNCMSMLI